MGDSGFTHRKAVTRPSGDRQTSTVRPLATFHDTAPNVDHTRTRVRIQIPEAVEVGLRQPRAGGCGRSCSYSFGDENVDASITGLGLTSANCITCLPVTALSVVKRNGSCTPATSR
jgi:hypothetical protein